MKSFYISRHISMPDMRPSGKLPSGLLKGVKHEKFLYIKAYFYAGYAPLGQVALGIVKKE